MRRPIPTHNPWHTIVAVGFVAVLVTAACSGGTPSSGQEPPEQEPPTSEAPIVIATAPGDRVTNVTPNAPIQVQFSESMDVNATEAAFGIDPSVSCGFTWNVDNTILTCTPSESLAEATTYEVEIAANATSDVGQTMERAIRFSFTTASPQEEDPTPTPTIVRTVPTNLASGVSRSTAIQIEFSVPMNRSSVEASFGTSPVFTCSPTWNSTNTVLTCTPIAALEPSTVYTVVVTTTAQSAEGVTLASPFAMTFGTEGASLRTALYVYGGPAPYDVYLGCLTCLDADPESIFNEFGQFGRFASPSMMNDFDQYGSAFSTLSACNAYASDPPRVFDQDGNYYGTLSVNRFAVDRITNPTYLERLENEVCDD